MATRITSKDPYTVTVTRGGLAFIASDTPLTRLHYFDGKRLAAADLTHEQSALRTWVTLANQAGGAGVVHGFDCHLASNDRLELGRGLAIDPDGRLLLLPDPATISIATLLAAASDPDTAPRPTPLAATRAPEPPRRPASSPLPTKRPDPAQTPTTRPPASARFTTCEPVRVPPPGVAIHDVELWLITLAHAETACGSEDVFGNPCESACVSSTDRPYLVEGVLLRAVPLALTSPLPIASTLALTRLHLRSRIAAAYFADDRHRVASLIRGPGLRAETWCLGSKLAGGQTVPIAVLARAAGETLFLDPWIPRRERIDPPPRQYWAARLAMRPWSHFLAEVLQFQCHLRDLLAEDPQRSPADPCARTRATLRRTSDEIRQLFNHYAAVSERLIHGQPDHRRPDLEPDLQDALARLERLHLDLDANTQREASPPRERLLIHGGIIELPAAGYLPVAPGRDVEQQVRDWLGEGVDLRFCTVRPDFVAHALEEAQHMDRISLTAGLDDPKAKPELDILVPDGQLITATRGVGVEFTAKYNHHTRPSTAKGPVHAILLPQLRTTATAHGAGRAEHLPGGGAALHLAGQLTVGSTQKPNTKPAPTPNDHQAPEPKTPTVEDILDPNHPTPHLVLDSKTPTVQDILDPHHAKVSPSPKLPPGDRSKAPNVAQTAADRTLSLGDMRGFLSATIDANPTDAAPGDRLAVHARLVVARTPDPPHLTDLDLVGTLRIIAIEPRIHAELTYAINDGPDAIQPLELGWKPAVSGLLAAELSFELTGTPTVALTLTLQWSPDAPHQVTADLSAIATTPMSPQQLVTEIRAQFDPNPAVLEPRSSPHTAAIAVIDALARAHEDRTFRPDALALLFPPRPSQPELHAPLDWVLFHRRRSKQCLTAAKPVPTRPVRPPLRPQPAIRTYRIHAATLDDLALGHGLSLASLPTSLATGKLSIHRFPEIGTARFPADADDMLTQDITPLKTAWQKIPAAFVLQSTLVYSTRANQDGTPRITAQARDVGDTLESRSAQAPQLPVHYLPQPPPSYSLEGIDGVIILLGRQRLSPTRSSVYWVDPKNLPRLNHDGNLAAFLKVSESTQLGTVAFVPQTDDLVDSDPTAILKTLHTIKTFDPKHPLIVHTFCDDHHPDAVPALLKSRSQTLATALNLKPRITTTSEHLNPRADLPGQNPMVILLSAPARK